MVSAQAVRPMPAAAVVAGPVLFSQEAVVTRQLLQKADVKKPATPKSKAVADSADKAFGRLGKP